MSDITKVLQQLERGESQAVEALLPLVYEELRRLAAHKMALEVPGQTLQPTALVHEAWLRLAAQEKQTYAGRSHFFAVAAEAMRRILIDRARRRRAVRRGGRLSVSIPMRSGWPLRSQTMSCWLWMKLWDAWLSVNRRKPSWSSFGISSA